MTACNPAPSTTPATTATRWLLTAAASIGLLALGAQLDAPSPTTEAQHMAEDAAQAVLQARSSAQAERLGLAVCRAELGPGAQLLWTVDGDMVCRPPEITATAATGSKGGAQ